MGVTIEELAKTLEQRLLPFVESKMQDLEKRISEESDKATAEQREKLALEREELQGKLAETQEVIDQLKAETDRKNIPAEDQPPKPHKFKCLKHFATDIYEAGPGGRDESEELADWRKYCMDTKAAGTPSQTVGEAEAGGYIVPTEYSEQAFERVAEKSDIMQKATIIPMASNKLDIPFINGFDESQGKVAGNVVFYWKGEEKQYTASDMELGSITLNLNKCTGMAYMSDEIMKWSRPSIEPLLMRAFDTGLTRAITKACIRGTGANEPRGVLDAPCALEVGKEEGQAADTFEIENVAKMFAQFYGEDENAAEGVWYMNKTLIPELVLMNLSVGTGGAGVFLANQAIQGRLNFSLLGLPITFTSQMSKLGDSGDVGLFDWAQYLIGIPTGQGGAETAQSIHLKFDYGQTCYRFTFYMDGQPWWPDTFKPEYGDEQSPFVKLEAR